MTAESNKPKEFLNVVEMNKILMIDQDFELDRLVHLPPNKLDFSVKGAEN